MSNYRELWNEAGLFNKSALENFFREGKDIAVEKAEENQKLYYTVAIKKSLTENPLLKEKLICTLQDKLYELLRRNGYAKGDKLLVAGLGNENITADSLGAKTLAGLNPSRHVVGKDDENRLNLSCIKPLVEGLTGISSFEIIKGVVKEICPKFLICIDTLACSSVKRIGRAVQLSDAGITPGGGVNNPKTCLNFDTLGIKVIAIGVPLVIYAKNILREYLEKNAGTVSPDEFLDSFIVSEKDVDIAVSEFAYCISGAINSL